MDRWEYERAKCIERQRAFMEAIRPILAVKSSIYAMTMPRLLIYPDSHMESEYAFTPEQQRILDQADEFIECVAKLKQGES